MGFGDDNSAAAQNARAGLSGIGDFLLRRQMQNVQMPQVQAETGLTDAQRQSMVQEAARNQWLFENVTQPMAQWRMKMFQDMQNGGDGSGNPAPPSGSTPAPSDSSQPMPSFGDVGNPTNLGVLPPGSITKPTTPFAPTPAPPMQTFNSGGRTYSMKMGKDGTPEIVDETGATTVMSDWINKHPDQIASLPPEFQDMATKQLSATGTALGNSKSAIDLENAARQAAYGSPEEQNRHAEFRMNAGNLSRRLQEYEQVVDKYGNWANTLPGDFGLGIGNVGLGTGNTAATALLSNLPLDIADNWTKVTNPSGVLREGLVHLGKEEQIPAGWDVLKGTTLGGIRQTKNTLADYVRGYENLESTRWPVEGLTPELRQMVDTGPDGKPQPTRASQEFEKRFGHPVPTTRAKKLSELVPESDVKQSLPNVSLSNSIQPPSVSRGDGTVPGSNSMESYQVVNSDADYAKLAPGTPYRYQDAGGAWHVMQKGGARNSVNAGSTAGAPKAKSAPPKGNFVPSYAGGVQG